MFFIGCHILLSFLASDKLSSIGIFKFPQVSCGAALSEAEPTRAAVNTPLIAFVVVPKSSALVTEDGDWESKYVRVVFESRSIFVTILRAAWLPMGESAHNRTRPSAGMLKVRSFSCEVTALTMVLLPSNCSIRPTDVPCSMR